MSGLLSYYISFSQEVTLYVHINFRLLQKVFFLTLRRGRINFKCSEFKFLGRKFPCDLNKNKKNLLVH